MARNADKKESGRDEARHPVSVDPVKEAEIVDEAADATARDLAIGWRLAWNKVKAAFRRALPRRGS